VPSLGTPARALAAGLPLEDAFGRESVGPLRDHVVSAPRAVFLIRRLLGPKLIGSTKDETSSDPVAERSWLSSVRGAFRRGAQPFIP
jgi:hypothetical protein